MEREMWPKGNSVSSSSSDGLSYHLGHVSDRRRTGQEPHRCNNMQAQICFKALGTETPDKETKRQGACWLGVQGNRASSSWHRARRGNKKKKPYVQCFQKEATV